MRMSGLCRAPVWESLSSGLPGHQRALQERQLEGHPLRMPASVQSPLRVGGGDCDSEEMRMCCEHEQTGV